MKNISIILAIVFLLSSIAPIPAAAVEADSSGKQVYEWNYGETRIETTYTLSEDVIREESVLYEDGEVAMSIIRCAAPDDTLSVYHNGVWVETITCDYDTFLAVLNGSRISVQKSSQASVLPRTIYQVCGSTLPHDLVSVTEETVNMALAAAAYNGMTVYISTQLSTFSVPAAVIYSLASGSIALWNSTNCEYVDFTESMYFVHDYTLGQSSNCYHIYARYYNITDTGAKQTVDAEWVCYEVIL